ncbi:MAG: DNA-processing protein DprA [Clostridiales bacterium]|nr:DNA-processing protein DprA [Clostridiales bacterium]
MRYTVAEQLQIVLCAAEGMTGAKYERLTEEIGDVFTVWESIKCGKAPEFLGARLIAELKRSASRDYFAEFFGTLAEHGISVFCRDSDGYPAQLLSCEDCPVILYAKGETELLRQPSIAIVGTRRCTRYGKEVAEQFAAAFVRAGATVISGMARGVDTAAHLSALEAGGGTVAVLGTGADTPYPAENRELYDRICESGLILSELPLGAKPLAEHFPRRNRIISGLSDAVVVVEAGEKSGALITAQYAMKQGRELFAVPGNINSLPSAGSNALLAEGAAAAVNAEAVLRSIGLCAEPARQAPQEELVVLTEHEKKLVKALLEEDLSADELSQRVALLPQEITTLLTMLELRGIVYRTEGRIFAVNRRKLMQI